MSEILSFNQVTYSYTPEEPHTRNAVEDVSFTINKGEWITIVGHNGSGKSTMAKLMSGLLMPQQGEIRIKREILTEENIWDIRSQIGIVFQNPDNQFVGATVQDDVAFSLENNGVPHEEMVKRVHNALRQVKMEDFINHEPHHLSGGQKQRVAIAGALAMHPQILILDEATSMLDPQGREEVLTIVEALRKEIDLTVLAITHDLEEALLADRIIFMNAGKKYAEGTPEEIFALGDDLVQFGLDMPFAMKMTKLLQAQGVQLVGQHMTEEELVNDLWTSNFNK
ncbi:energy-coupling factor ABC transporter ATP-binding protein [Solibacillus sp. FSL W7-1472]|uniref:ABC-type cobalt transport system, ATPase component n=2 Tax=Solibacillus TaxID=648800 RepID=F2F4D7_SOLSS|nr:MULTISPECIES: energy-coupling factor ABC transporter ATP-binding protein [Solibacillus]AMO87280.1 energy-coupling factor transporter ATPase [Solibacillus silvestris]EKB44613.1 Energy-coupling factor transporter ATP-binding protein EcfA1 [Solibacillus isronensis B3W22]OBW50212.1 energy-coupling factor transporter ATPase [Solibacillus silvestris]BAK14671.1 ABC-type cobalt transport system, ATPase component [Solibacillus silvestris StLB046]